MYLLERFDSIAVHKQLKRDTYKIILPLREMARIFF